ncbi:MAG: S49 family peptidase [Rhodoferax sp.]|nr:S49 family peptidase [Betaproteobacteria bacterium]NCN96736.1 S49 family peptidase [Rhodoferax sp.]OIP16858.1 MAG: S49 family peptidase [Comamonadaceae bacterium CG2_30_57_122]PIZ22962.1 MAG: S49 family peptidase [Comamonadaceae bacterium CG_4_10_14_0_8_um_filter_57_29]PJC19961.1 MAG: S49 family peptidase [Comamonadaceae bacterium CG_4_9_14_0_8_um_filter_57_21]
MNEPVNEAGASASTAQEFKQNEPLAQDNKGQSAMKNEAFRDESESRTWERATLEKLAFASLHEQRLARRWRIAVRLAWLVFFVALAWLGFSEGTAGKNVTTPHTAVIEIKGEIASGAEASADLIVSSLRAAFEDSGAQAVVLLINSPGGSPVQAGIINDEIKRLKALYKKPVYAVVEESAASAAYYIAVAADQIFVDKASIVGSIGVLMDGFGFTGLMDKLGVERRLMTAGANKGFLDPFSPQTDTQRAYAQTMLDQIHQQFIAVVKEGRGARLKETPETFSGLFWSGQQAIELGLADQLGSLDFVAREVVKAEEIIDYTRRDNVAERLVKRFGAAMGSGAVQALKATAALH